MFVSVVPLALRQLPGKSIVATIQDLRNSFTFVVATDNLRQAARPSDSSATIYLGELGVKIFTDPAKIPAEDCVTGRFG